MALSFIEKLKAMKLTEFNFTSFKKEMASVKDGEERVSLLVLTLDTPLEKVSSSTSEYDPRTNRRAHYSATDITEVYVKLANVEKYELEFTFDLDSKGELTGTGSYNGDMFLDLARRGNVWLTDVKFSTMSGDMKASNKSDKVADMLGIARI